jgi:hypothetical protein
MHQTTCTNNLNQRVPCINYASTLTHQDVPTSSTIRLMYVLTHQLYISCVCQLINYTPHVCANSSTTCLNHVLNMYHNHIPKTYTNIIIKSYLTIHHSIHKTNTINPYIKPCATTSLLCSVKLNQQLQQHITTKRPIPICQIPTTKYQLYPSDNVALATLTSVLPR